MRNIKLTIIFIAILVLILGGCDRKIEAYKPIMENKEQNFKGNLEEDVMKKVNELEIPGLQISVSIGDKRVNIALGTIDYDRKVPITTDHVLRVGSITKIYTSTIVMKLVEEKQISLEDTIDKWFPELKNSSDIKVYNLLNHTSGIFNYTENFQYQIKTILNKNKFWNTDELYKLVLKGEPYFEPGEDHYYSNSNYLLLGIIAEKVTEKTYENLVHGIVLDPLELKSTYFLPYEAIQEQLITGYDRDVLPFGVHEIDRSNTAWSSSGHAAGAIASTSEDLVKFLEGLFSGKIISDESINQMMVFGDFKDEDIPVQTGYGLGLRRFQINGDILVGHTGTIPGFGGAAFYCPDKDYYVTFLGNVSFLNQIELLETITRIINENK